MIRRFNLFVVVVCVVIVSMTAPASAADVSLGLGGAWQSSPYKGHDDTFLPLPLVNVEWDRLYINGLNAGVHIWKKENQAISFGVSYAGLRFDSKKTDDRNLKQLDDRAATLHAFLQYTLQTRYGHAGIKVLHDVLCNSDAFSVEASCKYPFMLGPVLAAPGAGLQWDSREQLDYYYGISSREAQRSGLALYKPNAGLSPFLSLEALWQFADNWSAIATGKALFLSKEIKDSPMVDEGQIFHAGVGIRYTF